MRIALVEDEKKLADSIKIGLEAENYLVTVLSDGLRAEAQLKKESFDVIILDLLLPSKDGFLICQALRNEGIATPIIILTARDTVADKVRALDSGADDLLTKPFSFEELVARLRALLRRPQSAAPAVRTVGALSLNVGTHSVTRDGRHVALTIKEFEILELLMRQPGQVISRTEMCKTLWNSDDTSLSNVVDVHVFNLRKKIDDQFTQKYIRTIRGLGYAIKT